MPLSQSPFLDNIYGRREDLPRRSSLGTKKRQSVNNNSLYQYIDSKYKIRGGTADSRMSEYTPTKNSTEIKSKGFKLKPSKPVDIPITHEKERSRTKRDLIGNDKIPLELQ